MSWSQTEPKGAWPNVYTKQRNKPKAATITQFTKWTQNVTIQRQQTCSHLATNGLTSEKSPVLVPGLLILAPYKSFAYLLPSFLTDEFLLFLTVPYSFTSLKIDPFRFQARYRKKRPNLAFVFLCLSIICYGFMFTFVMLI